MDSVLWTGLIEKRSRNNKTIIYQSSTRGCGAAGRISKVFFSCVSSIQLPPAIDDVFEPISKFRVALARDAPSPTTPLRPRRPFSRDVLYQRRPLPASPGVVGRAVSCFFRSHTKKSNDDKAQAILGRPVIYKGNF